MSKANPLQLYNAIVHARQMNPLSPGRNVEAHHVIPKSLGGSDDDWNRVNLTKDEHEMCHYLLTFIYPTGEEHEKALYAWRATDVRVHSTLVSPQERERLLAEYRVLWSKHMLGEGNPFYGKQHTEEAKRKNREAHVGKPSPLRGKPRTEEEKRKMSESKRGKPNYKARKPVIATKDGIEMEFASVKEAAKSIGSASNLISTRLRQNKPCKGYTLRYKEAM